MESFDGSDGSDGSDDRLMEGACEDDGLLDNESGDFDVVGNESDNEMDWIVDDRRVSDGDMTEEIDGVLEVEEIDDTAGEIEAVQAEERRDLKKGGDAGCAVTKKSSLRPVFIGPLSSSDQNELDKIKLMNCKFDDEDARRLLVARKELKNRKSTSTPRKWTKRSKAAWVASVKRSRGWSTPQKGTTQFSRREKTILGSVREFNEKESKNYKTVTGRVDEYVKERIDKIACKPFSSPMVRTEAMTGIPARSIRRFVKQEKTAEVTPKKRLGRVNHTKPEDWMLSDIRLIVAGMSRSFPVCSKF